MGCCACSGGSRRKGADMETVLAALALCLLAAPSGERPPAATRWIRVAPGLEFRTMDGTGMCRRGSPAIAVARVDPGRWRLEPFLETSSGASRGHRTARDIDHWQKATGAALIFNAGQYRPDRVPMGLFVKDGRDFGSGRVKAWKGILVAEPSA